MNKYNSVIFIAIALIVFIDYDLYFPIMLIYILSLLFLFNENINILINRIERKVVQIIVFFFIFAFRFLPVLFENTLPIINKISQQNYLIGDGNYFAESLFLDMQVLLFSISCNSSQSKYYDSKYLIKYSGYADSKSSLSCPYDANYGYLFDFFKLNPDNIWFFTLIISSITLLLFFLIYLKTTKGLYNLNFLIISAIFLSPPINFVIHRLNIDLLIFLVLFFIYNIYNSKYLSKIFILFLLVLIKFYPIFLIISEMLLKMLKKDYKKFIQTGFFLLLSLIYLFFSPSNINSVSYFVKPTESHRSFGVLNDFLYFRELFSNNYLIFVIVLFLFFLIFLFKNTQVNTFKINQTEYKLLIFFIGISLFINYDYRLVFFILFYKALILRENRIFLASTLLFMYTSPSLLHAYIKFDIVQNNYIYFFDFSFYLLLVFCIKIVIKELLDFKNNKTSIFN